MSSLQKWTITLAAATAIAAILVGNVQRERDAKREVLNLVATITGVPTYCPDDKAPFYVTIRNLADRTAVAARFTLYENPQSAGTLPSDQPKVSLKAPLPPGQSVSDCYALNRYRLIARGVDPRKIIWSAMPSDVVFE